MSRQSLIRRSDGTRWRDDDSTFRARRPTSLTAAPTSRPTRRTAHSPASVGMRRSALVSIATACCGAITSRRALVRHTFCALTVVDDSRWLRPVLRTHADDRRRVPQHESFIDTRYAADGITPLGPPVAVAHAVDPRLRTARSSAWDVGVDHKFNAMWSVHGGIIGRSGRNELLLKTAAMPSGTALGLESSGRSLYRGNRRQRALHPRAARRSERVVRSLVRPLEPECAYVFYDSVLAPVVGEDAYAPASSDVPHRLLMPVAHDAPTKLAIRRHARLAHGIAILCSE